MASKYRDPKLVDPQQPASLNTTGSDSGGNLLGDLSLGGILGTNKADSFYEEFYNELLTTANCPPINALWLVFIHDMPIAANIIPSYKQKENSLLTNRTYEKAASEGRRRRGILLAQGVKHTGDGTQFSREGYSNTGLWKGVLSNGRSDLNTLDISFLESNVSFVDNALRPWAVAVAHNGLTDPKMYANTITVWHLSKMGARNNFAKRKVFKYHNCFPISIDQQEYNYGGDDVNIKRAVSFGYHYYTVEDADSEVLDLLGYGEKEKGFLEKAFSYVGNEISSQLGANNLGQYLNNIVERAKSFTKSVVSNTVKGAITNVGGAVQGAVDGAIRDVTSEGLAAGNNAVSSVSKAANDAVNKVVGSNPNEDTPFNRKDGGNQTVKAAQALGEAASASRLSEYGYVEKSVSSDDVVNNIIPKTDQSQEDLISPTEVNINVGINENDTPNNITKDVFENDEGGITIIREKNVGNPNDDTPNFLGSPSTNLLYYTEKEVKADDTPSFANGLPDSKPISGFKKGSNNTPNNTDTLSKPSNTFKTGAEQGVDSNINSVESAFELTVEVDKNDSNIGDDLLYYEEIEISKDDDNPSQSIKFVEKNSKTSTGDAL